MKGTGQDGRAAMRFIVATGVFVFLGLYFVSWALRQGLKLDEEGPPAEPPVAQSPVDGQGALERARHIVETFPRRVPGTEATSAFLDGLRADLEAAGYGPRRFGKAAPDGKGASLVARRQGSSPGRILLMCRYDTPEDAPVDDGRANAQAAAPALLLALAEALPAPVDGPEVHLAWLGGEGDAALLAEEWERMGRLGETAAAIYLESAGDCHLPLKREANGTPALLGRIAASAEALGYAGHFGDEPFMVPGPHLAFRARGIDAVALADRVSGRATTGHGRLHNTSDNGADALCAGSLQAVGDVLYHLVCVTGWEPSEPAPPGSVAAGSSDEAR